MADDLCMVQLDETTWVRVDLLGELRPNALLDQHDFV